MYYSVLELKSIISAKFLNFFGRLRKINIDGRVQLPNIYSSFLSENLNENQTIDLFFEKQNHKSCQFGVRILASLIPSSFSSKFRKIFHGIPQSQKVGRKSLLQNKRPNSEQVNYIQI